MLGAGVEPHCKLADTVLLRPACYRIDLLYLLLDLVVEQFAAHSPKRGPLRRLRLFVAVGAEGQIFGQLALLFLDGLHGLEPAGLVKFLTRGLFQGPVLGHS